MNNWAKREIYNNVWEKTSSNVAYEEIGPEYCYSIDDALIIEIVDYTDHYTLNIRSKTELPLESIDEDNKEYFMIFDNDKYCKDFSKNNFSLEELMTISFAEAKDMGWPIKNITYKIIEIDQYEKFIS